MPPWCLPVQVCMGTVAASCVVRSEVDKGACKVKAEAATGLKVVAGLLARRNDCASMLVPTLNEIFKGFINKKATQEQPCHMHNVGITCTP